MSDQPTQSQQADQTKQSKQASKSNNDFKFEDNHVKAWGNTFVQDGPIARAWARAYESGVDVGSPTSDATEDNSVIRQSFQLANAICLVNDKMNPNQTVYFNDARGLVTSNSGL